MMRSLMIAGISYLIKIKTDLQMAQEILIMLWEHQDISMKEKIRTQLTIKYDGPAKNLKMW